ncbi:uncharacterized protein BP01DRAFT_102853 [Aspergillus saccharolyticus JOP 1030-1]|uniref:Uncharacterized protein n=1 Tax=Aspergillus saccharolyticus JOP 1030-1 TaxID=1450539 RepID=A0A318Z7S8_9EURO|nr:hypothetical protein BP01DRAFT_102853 [Aspergillus saccharolyticus JOP 1030-1]PYH43361.1 hypothetical protein BP01DRAFT_102853 [Aspergillus saccharolyticus JOP 1030-1]
MQALRNSDLHKYETSQMTHNSPTMHIHPPFHSSHIKRESTIPDQKPENPADIEFHPNTLNHIKTREDNKI